MPESDSQLPPLDPVEAVIDAVRRGEMVLIVDDEDRENEGDLIMAAECARAEDINFMIRFGRGLVCVGMDGRLLESLGLAPVPSTGKCGGRFSTAFTQSVDARDKVSTGISAADRAHTIRLLADPEAGAPDLVSPGHVFPIKAHPEGVLGRRGHTEAASDLARLAGFAPVGVLCEVLLDDGNMARMADLRRMATEWNLRISSVEALAAYRAREAEATRHE